MAETLGQDAIDRQWADNRELYDKEMEREIVRYQIAY